jgi:hypothetical protein
MYNIGMPFNKKKYLVASLILFISLSLSTPAHAISSQATIGSFFGKIMQKLGFSVEVSQPKASAGCSIEVDYISSTRADLRVTLSIGSPVTGGYKWKIAPSASVLSSPLPGLGDWFRTYTVSVPSSGNVQYEISATANGVTDSCQAVVSSEAVVTPDDFSSPTPEIIPTQIPTPTPVVTPTSVVATFSPKVIPPFTAPPRPSCIPRPACLDATPSCKPAEPEDGWCPVSTPTSVADALLACSLVGSRYRIVGDLITFKATGGSGNYVWKSKGAVPATELGKETSVTYSSPGRKYVYVYDGGIRKTCASLVIRK